MKEHELKKAFKDALDSRLASLTGDPQLAQRILRGTERRKETKMKKRFSMGLAFALVALLLMATAWAAGLIFSPRYDAVKLANQALQDKYGITDRMMSQFYRKAQPNSDGSTTVTYESVEHIEQLGIYTITVRDGKAEASWSLDDKYNAGRLEDSAWGPEQIERLLTDYAAVMQYLQANAKRTEKAPSPASLEMIQEEAARKREEVKAQVLRAATLSLAEAKENAVLALENEYQLSQEQLDLLMSFEGDETYAMEDNKPLLSLYFFLDQEGEGWKEKDGIYVVTVNLTDGVIEDILYDSALGGNG